MYLEKIKITNFRLFSDLDLTLNQGMNILVGENDSGKTTLIDAIRYTLGTNTSEKNYIKTSDFNDNSKNFIVTLKFSNLDSVAHIFLEHLTYEQISENVRKAVLYISLKASISDKEKRGYPLIKTEYRSGLNGSGPIIDSDIKLFLATTYLKPLRDAENELASGKGSRLSQILGSSKDFKDVGVIDEILNLIAQTNTQLMAPNKPISVTSNLIREKYLHKLIFEDDKEIIQAIIDIAGVKIVTGLTLGEKKKYLREVLESLHLSLSARPRNHGLGYQNLLFMAAELLLLEQDSEIESPLLLIEEPEAHLHPQLQMRLLDFLMNKVQKLEDAKGLQCILTTHSPNLASKANPENIIIMSKGKAFSLRKSETKLLADDYIFLQKFLDVTKANLFFSRGVILVEGDSENILIPTIAKLLGRPLEGHGISIINIGSTAWKRFAKLFLRVGKDDDNTSWLPIKVAVLRDLDLWPDCAEEIPENAYGFKTKLPGNLNYWESSVADIENYKVTLKDNLEKQNVKIFVSDKWTFEYCLSRYGLFQECYNVLNNLGQRSEEMNTNPEELTLPEDSVLELGVISGSPDEKATYILREVLKKKTDLAQKIAIELERIYFGKPDELKQKLPPYIVSAIEYVTDIENTPKQATTSV